MISGTWLITGLRGNGKTLRAVGLMKEHVAAGRPVFASNFSGLNVPGVQLLDDPRQWEDLPPESVLFVDEAQRYWRSRRSGDPSPEVVAMETQRHTGISMVLLTQQPTYLDKHVRGLVDRHFHLIRRAGLEMSQVYEWERCKDEPENPTNMELAEKSVFNFPKEDYSAYTSAEVHTIKRRIPMRVKLMAAGAVAVVGMMWFALDKMKSSAIPETEAAPVASAAGTATGKAASSESVTYRTAQEYMDAMRPRIAAVPWSAPAYDGREIVAEPVAYCMKSGPGLDGNGKHAAGRCGCLTEQGTRYDMPDASCRAVVDMGGVYNPFKAPERDGERAWREPGAGQGPAVEDAPASAVAPVAMGKVGQLPAYGAFRGQASSAPR